MYSRYTPNGRGGYDRRRIPDPPPLHEKGPGPPRVGPDIPPPPPGTAIPPPSSPGYQPPGPAPGLLFAPQGLLSRLLPRGLESEDLLVLAVLLLSMKQDGATVTELLIAAGLYFLLE